VAIGFDGRINYTVVDSIKGRQVYSECTAWGVLGRVWWSGADKCWNAEIMKKGNYIASLSGEAIEDLFFNIKKFCGLSAY